MEVPMSKKVMVVTIVFGLIGIVHATLVNNGGFDTNAADWNSAGGGGAWDSSHIATGGNPGGYITLQSANNTWSVWYQVINESLAVWGIPSGTPITFKADMIDLGTAGNSSQGGLKAESYAGATKLTPGDGVNVLFTVGKTWQPVSFNYTMEPGTDNLKFVLVNVNYNGQGVARYGFDNIEFLIPGGTPALKPVPIVGGELPAANDVLRWTNPDPNDPADTLTADVFILQSDTILTKDPNLGPDILDPGVVQVADDIAAESLDLSDAGYTLQAGKYYYWAVHITDPEIGVVEGFDWHFLATEDSPPTNVSAGADQYVWLVDGTTQFTLTGTYADDGKSSVNVEWADLSNPLEQAPGTTVTINSPTSAETTVDVDGDGWFLFRFTATDAVGSGTDTVNVGVYVDACAAAKADPADHYQTYAFVGDVNNDCKINLDDLSIMAATWLDCLSDKLGCTP